jgi:glycogen synthase kinase 3 beta
MSRLPATTGSARKGAAAPTSSKSKSSSSTSKKPRYTPESVIGSGSFGVVYRARSIDTGEVVAIKKVREDKRYKNRELAIMRTVQHPNIVTLKNYFYSRISRDIFLNLVMEYIPETLYSTVRKHAKARQSIPFLHVKLYMYQMFRALAYCHHRGICHRDIKPQNLLLDPKSHTVKLCDFGSAKELKDGEPSVAYICSRYYRAPELIFESAYYKSPIDVWSLGCVFGELFLTVPLFQGERSVDQLVEIIKVLGTPSTDEIKELNPAYAATRFPLVQPLPWRVVFKKVGYAGSSVSDGAIDLIGQLLRFVPRERLHVFDALAHPYFDELREPDIEMPGGVEVPPLFNFTDEELAIANTRRVAHLIIPRRLWPKFGIADKSASSSATTSPSVHAGEYPDMSAYDVASTGRRKAGASSRR